MTPKQKAVIANTAPGRIIEIAPEPKVRFYTAHDNHKAKKEREGSLAVTELLECEQRRLIRTWNAKNG